MSFRESGKRLSIQAEYFDTSTTTSKMSLTLSAEISPDVTLREREIDAQFATASSNNVSSSPWTKHRNPRTSTVLRAYNTCGADKKGERSQTISLLKSLRTCHQAACPHSTSTKPMHPAAKKLHDRMPQKPLPNSLTEAHHVPTLQDQPPSSLTVNQQVTGSAVKLNKLPVRQAA